MSIHEQNYVRYEGTLHDKGTSAVIAWATIRTFWSFTRTKLTVLLLGLPTLVAIILIFIEYSVRNSQLGALAGPQVPGTGPTLFFMQAHVMSIAILFMASGCGVIADDLRYRTFQLYFSKPLKRWEYGVGKFLGLFSLGALVSLIPTLFCVLLRIALFARTDYALLIAKQMALAWLMLGVATAVMSAIVLGLSSLTSRTGYAVLSWIGALIVPVLVTSIIQIASKGSDVANLGSIPGSIHLASRALIDADPISVPIFAPFLVLLLLAGAGIGAMSWRISTLEGVA